MTWSPIEPAAPADPYEMFARWFTDAERSEINDPNAMTVATVDAAGRPSVRVVLLKGYDPDGFVFYTNLDSRKGSELKARPVAALCFHWKSLRRQVRIEGGIGQVSDAEADVYYQTRPYLSRIGAWASLQSRPLDERATLERRVAELSAQYPEGAAVPRPAHWSGFRLTPDAFEFWEDRPFRLHDRVTYHGHAGAWQLGRLYP